MAIPAGTRLGPYEITAPIGAGGMGEVYRARDTKLHRDVAVKVLPPAFVQDPDRLSRFEREAQSLAALNHPHIAQIYGVLDSPPALAMELVDGEDLSVRIARGPIPIAEALPLAIQIAEALECAHERGIVHRDLKPANIKISESGSVKVLDFGLAKAMASDASGPGGPLENSPTFTSPAMTAMGLILGTAAYMAPEQAKGKPVDRRADVWAFGGVLFEMLTGQRAFAGEDITDVIASIMRAEPEWTALPADTPPAVRKLLRRCLEKDRARRLDSMAVARYEIQEALVTPDPLPVAAAAAPARPLWRRALPFAATAAAATVLAGLLTWLGRPAPSAPVVRFAVTLPEGQAMGTTGPVQMALSNDGKRLAYVANREIFVRSLDAMQPVRVYENPSKLPVSSLTLSPDGTALAFWSDASIMRVPVAGGAAVMVTAAKAVHGMTWVDDALIYASNNKFFRVPAAGGEPEMILSLADDEFTMRPQLLPDGRTMLFTLTKGNALDRWDHAVIAAQRIGESSPTTLVTNASEGRYLPTGHLVYAQGGVLFAAPFDPDVPRLTDAAVPVVEGVARGVGLFFGGTAHYVVSQSGTLAHLPGPKESSSRARSRLVLADGASAVEALKAPQGSYSEPRLSPDGRYVAFSSGEGNDSNIWVYDVKQGGSPRRLTFGGSERFPVWTADSTRLAYQAQRDGDTAVFWQRADGSDVPARLTKPEAGTAHIPHALTKDGTLLLDVHRGDTYTLTLLKRDGTLQPYGGIASLTITSPTLSPDGTWVSYTARHTGQSAAVFVQPFPATGAFYQVSKATEDGHHSVWSRDGRTLFYTPGPGPVLVAVPVMATTAFTMGEPKTLNRQFGNQPPQISRPYDVAADGRFLGIGSATGTGNAGGNTVLVVLNWFEELKARVPVR